MLYYPVLYNLLSMVALGNTRLNEKLVTKIQSQVKPQAKNFKGPHEKEPSMGPI